MHDFIKPPYKTKEICMAVMGNKSELMRISHCKPDWDQYTALCWPPTPKGTLAKLPCPNDGFLNPTQYAFRSCLTNATWFVNVSFDDNPYTNFEDCLLPRDPTAEDDLKKLVNEKVILVLKSLERYKNMYLICFVVSIVLLVAASIVCASVVVKLKSNRQMWYTYALLAVAAAALLVNNVVTLSVDAVDDASNILGCRAGKSFVLLSVIVFYGCVLGYLYFCMLSVLDYKVKRKLLATLIITLSAIAFLLVTAEFSLEMFIFPNEYCGFMTMQSIYHWFTTAPRFLLIMSCLCLNSVLVYGVFCLYQPHLQKSHKLCHIRQKALSSLFVILFCTGSEALYILLHSEAYMNYTEAPIDIYLQAFTFMNAVQGIVFSVIMCLIDLEVLAMIGFTVTCKDFLHEPENCDSDPAKTSFSGGQFSRCNANDDSTQADATDAATDLDQALECMMALTRGNTKGDDSTETQI